MTDIPARPIRSPSYPAMALRDAVAQVAKIESQYRATAVEREVAARLIGYSSLSGPANAALAALASFGLVERAGKGQMRVTSRARAILHASDERERIQHLLAAANEPDLFREIIDRFEGIAVPPEDGVITYLNRQGFNPSAVRPAARAFLQTMAYVEELRGSESHGNQSPCPSESTPPVVEGGNAKAYGGAKVGDLIQWESQGSLQFPTPRRVRFVTEDGLWVAVEGSETGIPMNEVMVENRAGAIAPNMPHIPKEAEKKAESEAGFEEWFRAKVGAGKQIQILYRGGEDIGPKEVQKLIDILAAQKIALEE